MKIFIVGLPGSGKSTIGKALALLTGYRFTDTDEIIIASEKQSIEDIFNDKGEAYFRESERKALQHLLPDDNLIVSTGGGLPCFFDNMKVINDHGTSIFLNVPPAAIAERLWTTENLHRPLIKGKNKEQLLDFLYSKLNERLPYYRQAGMEFEGDTISAEQIYQDLKTRKIL